VSVVYEHVFLVARPGVLLPITMPSPKPRPWTRAERDALVAEIAEAVQVPPQFVIYLTTNEFDEPAPEPKPSPLITPDRKIVVPPGVKV